jgi:aspartate kinase
LVSREDFRSELAKVAAHLKELNQQYAYLGLDKAGADEVVDGLVAQALVYLESAVTMLASGYLNEGILLAAREILASLGETAKTYQYDSNLGLKNLKEKSNYQKMR